MANLTQHQSAKRSRVLVVGEQGSGKSTLLAALVRDLGQELFVLDYDDGLDNLRSTLPSELHHKVHFETLRDSITWSGDGIPMVKGKPTAFIRTTALLRSWKDSETGEDFGPVETWGPERTLVIDSGTFMGKAAMNYTKWINKRNGKQTVLKDWGNAMDREMSVLEMLTGDGVKCNVVIIYHLKHLRVSKYEGERAEEREDKEKEEILTYEMFPSALGQTAPKNLGAMFNVVVQAKRKGHGAGTRYVVSTVPDKNVSVKVPLSESMRKSLPAELSNSSGLADIFRAIQSS